MLSSPASRQWYGLMDVFPCLFLLHLASMPPWRVLRSPISMCWCECLCVTPSSSLAGFPRAQCDKMIELYPFIPLQWPWPVISCFCVRKYCFIFRCLCSFLPSHLGCCLESHSASTAVLLGCCFVVVFGSPFSSKVVINFVESVNDVIVHTMRILKVTVELMHLNVLRN